jgi:hypothetical protein
VHLTTHMSPVPRFKMRRGHASTSTTTRRASSSIDVWETRYQWEAQRFVWSPHQQHRDEMKQTTRCAVRGAPKMILEANDPSRQRVSCPDLCRHQQQAARTADKSAAMQRAICTLARIKTASTTRRYQTVRQRR